VPFQGAYGSRAVKCPTCGADVGVYCKRPSGWAGRFAAYHKARRDLAGRVRLIGLRCSRCGIDDSPTSYISPASREAQFEAVGYAGQPLCRPCAVALVPESSPSFE
jgi:hypothetical protein